MTEIERPGNLNQSTVHSLKSTAKPRAPRGEVVGSFSVEMLKSGGSMDLSGVAEGNAVREAAESASDAAPLQRGRKQVPKARNSHKSDLPVEEQVQQLSKIRKSAIEYEAVLMDQMVKQMRQSPLTKTPGGDTFSDIAEEPFRNFLSQAGGLGLADSITSQIARQQGLEQTLQEYPEIMGPGWRPSIPPNLMKKTSGVLDMTPETAPRQGPNKSSAAAEAAGTERSAESEAAATAEKKAGAGLMSDEEIAWLYNDAIDGLA